MNDDDRKLLTEFLGELFRPGLVGMPYTFEGKTYSNRTFTTPDDFFALVKRLRETGKVIEFCKYLKAFGLARVSESCYTTSTDRWYIALDCIDPARFSGLVAEWLKGEKG